MQQIAGFTPQTPALVPQGGPLSSGQGATGMGRHISRQDSSYLLPSAPPSAAAAGQSLSARHPEVVTDCRMLPTLAGMVGDHWSEFRFNMDVYQQAVGLEAQLQGLKDACSNLPQAGVVADGAGLSDKMQALCGRLEELCSDYAGVQEQLVLSRAYEAQYLQQMAGRMAQLDGQLLPAQQGGGLHEAVIPQVQSGLLTCDPATIEEIQPLQSGEVESEVISHIRQYPDDQIVNDDGRIPALDELCVALGASSLQSEAGRIDTMEQELFVLSEDGLHEAVIPQVQSGLLTCDPVTIEEIQPQQRDEVESEIIPHIRQYPDDQIVSDDGRIPALDELCVALGTSSLQSEAGRIDIMEQELFVLSEDVAVSGEPIDDSGAEPGLEYEELESKIADLSHGRSEAQGAVADAGLEHQAQMLDLIESHRRDLESCQDAHRREIADLQAAHQKKLDYLLQELSQANDIVHDHVERLQTLTDRRASDRDELRELHKTIKLHAAESKQLKEQTKVLQQSHEALLVSHQADVDQMTSAHQEEIDRLQREHRTQTDALNQQIGDMRTTISDYKTLLKQKSDLVAVNESTLSDYDAQLRNVSAVTEKLASSFTYVDAKHGEVQQALKELSEELSEVIGGIVEKMAKGQKAVEGQKAGELVPGLEACGTQLADLKRDVDDVKKELDSARDALGRSILMADAAESSTADESDVARTRVSVGRREVEI